MYRRIFSALSLGILLGFGSGAHANLSSRPAYMLPMSCAELLPDMSPYVGFLETVANGTIATDKELAKRLLRILALRDKVQNQEDRPRDLNPIDLLIRRTLCFYREQKEPLRPVPYDDPDFRKFLRGALRELEIKIEDAVFQTEFERAQRREYEVQLDRNRELVQKLKTEAEVSADRSFDRLSASAKKKVKGQ